MANFRSIQFSGAQRVATVAELAWLEEITQSPLPTSYKEFLLAVNGGRPRPSGFRYVGDPVDAPTRDDDMVEALQAQLDYCSNEEDRKRFVSQISFFRNAYIPSRVDHFLGFGYGDTPLEVLLEACAAESAPRPLHLLPIASDDSGDFICMVLDAQRGGPIIGRVSGAYEVADVDDDVIDDISEIAIASNLDGFLSALFPSRVSYAKGFVPSRYDIELHKLDTYDE